MGMQYLDSHVGVRENHVEVIVSHAELFPKLRDQVLVHHVLLPKTLHWLVVFCTNNSDGERPTPAVHVHKCRHISSVHAMDDCNIEFQLKGKIPAAANSSWTRLKQNETRSKANVGSNNEVTLK